MTLSLPKAVFDQLLKAAQGAAPLEACGLLAGTSERVEKCYILDNVDASSEHYSMRPEDQFAAVKDMRRNGFRMLAIWHSHPASPAMMSEEDMRLAYTPYVLYVILSLVDPGLPRIRAFDVKDNVATEVPIVEDVAKGGLS